MTSLKVGDEQSRAYNDDENESYTRRRLQHATPEHLHLTSRRYFIGPIPANWLKNHHSWAKRQLQLTNYSSKAATFHAAPAPSVSDAKRVTALNGSPDSTPLSPSFPQPYDLDEESGVDEESDQEDAVQDKSTASPPPQHTTAQIVATDKAANTSPTEPDSAKNSSQNTAPPSRAVEAAQAQPKSRASHPSDTGASFVTAREHLPKALKTIDKPSGQRGNKPRSPALSTAEEEPVPSTNETSRQSTRSIKQPSGRDGPHTSLTAGQPFQEGEETASTSSLIPHDKGMATKRPSAHSAHQRAIMSSDVLQDAAPEEYEGPHLEEPLSKRASRAPSPGLLRFNLPNRATKYENQVRTKFAQVKGSKRFRKEVLKPGETVKAEKMLVRVDYTIHEIPKDYDESGGMKVESTAVEKWREFVVVCRKNTHSNECEFVIQMCKSRVIPGVENDQKLKKAAHLIPMDRRTTRVNLYSTLDKTIVMWAPWKKGTRIYILKPQSAASAVEWYTFLQSSLGWRRAKGLQVNVPDLDVSLDIENPFEQLEQIKRSETLSGENGATVVQKTFQAEQAAATSIIQQSMKMLEENPEWEHVISAWLNREKMGLAWKKYDRLEWVHGPNEQRMYGTLAIQKTHDLELRPKQHYPTSVSHGHEKARVEPAAVEGFLIRLTTQKGQHSRLGKKYFNRMYFYTHNQFLCFCKPGKADPPASPQNSACRPSEAPLIYAVDPFPIRGKDIEWLDKGTPTSRQRHDQLAYSEAERKINTLLVAEGFVNLCHVTELRNVQDAQAGAQPPDIEQQAPAPEPADAHENDFEVVFQNGLVLRLRSFNTVTRKEWIARLTDIAEYWKARTTADMNAYKVVRQANFERLKLDEEMESFIGQAAKKWEVSRSVASPELFNMCGISSCRAITVSRFSNLSRSKKQKHPSFHNYPSFA